MRLKAILFDLDGTLVDSALSIGMILNQMRQENNLDPVDISTYKKWISLGAADLIVNALEINHEEAQVNLMEFRALYSSIQTPPEAIFPFVPDMLQDFMSSGIAMGVCSNKPVMLCHKVLNDLALNQYFSCVVGGDSTPNPKPSRSPIDFALKELNHHADNALFIGDSAIDQQAAYAAGIPFIFFSGGYDDGMDVMTTSGSIAVMQELLPLIKTKGWI